MSEVSDAAGELPLNVRTRQWHDALIAPLGLDGSMLPPPLESPQVTGWVTRRVAERAGVPEGIAVGAGAKPKFGRKSMHLDR